MKIALPIDGDNLESVINHSFGRTKQFIIIDDSSMEFELVDNAQNLQAAQGAGIQSAQNIAAAGAQTVIAIHCGPKAFKVLNGSAIDVYVGIKGTAMENVKAFKACTLEKMDSANMESHWV